MYNVPVDQIREFNASSLGSNDLINVGQELVISLPDGMPTPTPIPSTPAPTNEPIATPTTNASLPVTGYLAEFVAIANEVERLPTGDYSQIEYVFNQLDELSDRLGNMQVPPEAKMMHDAFTIYVLASALEAGALMAGDTVTSNAYMNEAIYYWGEYVVHRSVYLEALGYSTPESAGFIPID